MNIIALIRSLIGKAQFASLTYTTKESKETARYTVILGATYRTLLDKSLLALTLLDLPTLAKDKGMDLALLTLAQGEVQKSLEKSIAAHAIGQQNADYTKRGQYASLGAGLNVNETDGSLQLFGLVQSKVVLQPGEHKVVNSKPLTLAKKAITKALPIGKFREFALDAGNIQAVKLDGTTLVFE